MVVGMVSGGHGQRQSRVHRPSSDRPKFADVRVRSPEFADRLLRTLDPGRPGTLDNGPWTLDWLRTIPACARGSSGAWAGRCRKSATDCGAWAAGRARTTTSRWRPSSSPSRSAARSSTRRWRTATARASNCSARCSHAHRDKTLRVATKIPPKNLRWPAMPEYPLDRRLPRRSHPAVAPRSASRTSASNRRPSAVPRLDRRVGRG